MKETSNSEYMSENLAAPTEMLLEEEKMAPLKILTQNASSTLATDLGEHPELELLKDVDLQTAREQAKADADFESVNFKMVSASIKAAEEADADLLFFTNEQQDQLGLCARKSVKGRFQLFTAHQIVLLLNEVLLEQYRRNDVDENSKDPLIIRSLVLSDVIEVQTAYEHIKSVQTYTGLEALSQAVEEHQEEYNILVAVDEANHILFPGHSPQESIEMGIKLIAEKALALKKEGETLYDYLIALYKQYGFYQEKSFTISRSDEGKDKHIKNIMDDLRKQSPDFLFGQPVRMLSDFNKKFFFNFLTAKKGKTTLAKADILQYVFADNTKVTVVPDADYSKLFYHFSVNSRIMGKEAFEEAKVQANEQIVKMMGKIGKI